MKAVRKYLLIARVSLTNAFAYRAEVASRLLFYALIIFVFFSLWSAIYKGDSIHGFTHAQVVWYLIATELIAFGVPSRDVVGQISDDVKTGSLAYVLGRPMHYVGYYAALTLGRAAISLMMFGGLAVVLGLIFAGPLPGFPLWATPMMLLSGALGAALQFFMVTAIGLTAFFIEDNSAVYLIYQKLVFMLGVFLPVEFLPPWLQGWARLLPFSYVTWAPARLFVAFSWDRFFQVVPAQLLWTAAAAALALSLYRAGARRLTVQGG